MNQNNFPSQNEFGFNNINNNNNQFGLNNNNNFQGNNNNNFQSQFGNQFNDCSNNNDFEDLIKMIVN